MVATNKILLSERNGGGCGGGTRNPPLEARLHARSPVYFLLSPFCRQPAELAWNSYSVITRFGAFTPIPRPCPRFVGKPGRISVMLALSTHRRDENPGHTQARMDSVVNAVE